MLDTSEWLFEGRFRLFLPGTFVFIGLLAAIDLVVDIREGAELLHIIVELFVFVISIFSASTLTFRLLAEAKKSRQLISRMTLEIKRNKEEASAWKHETEVLLQGLGASINNQFERWGLSPSEKEIGLFLLKGLSHKEVASIRGVSEATARQQARSIYKKAGLSGRYDLSAFFLEELALP